MEVVSSEIRRLRKGQRMVREERMVGRLRRGREGGEKWDE